MKPLTPLVSIVSLLGFVSTLCAQSANSATHGTSSTPGYSANAHAAPSPHTPNPNASAKSNAIQAILQKFDASRDQLVTTRQALVDRLATATTDAERQAILAQLREDQKAMQEVQRATAKEIRNELQTLRRQRTGGG
jgi:hypothetical protein